MQRTGPFMTNEVVDKVDWFILPQWSLILHWEGNFKKMDCKYGFSEYQCLCNDEYVNYTGQMADLRPFVRPRMDETRSLEADLFRGQEWEKIMWLQARLVRPGILIKHEDPSRHQNKKSIDANLCRRCTGAFDSHSIPYSTILSNDVVSHDQLDPHLRLFHYCSKKSTITRRLMEQATHYEMESVSRQHWGRVCCGPACLVFSVLEQPSTSCRDYRSRTWTTHGRVD